jgi:hypothetical protein
MTRTLLFLLAVGLVLPLPAASEVKHRPLEPTNLLKLNTAKDEDDPHAASSGLRLYYSSQVKGRSTVLVSQRRRREQTWPPGKPMDELQGKADYRSVFLTPDSKYPQYLYFSTTEAPEKEDTRGDNFDIYFLIKQGPRDDFTTETPVHSVCTKADEMDPWLTADGRRLYFSRKDKDGWHVYVATRPGRSGQFRKPVRVDFPAGFRHATLTPDGLIMYLQGPLEKERWGLFRSKLVKGKWSEPEPLTELNSPKAPRGDLSPCLSRNGLLLYFASDRPGGKGGLDLWVIPTALLKRP